jgi:hypothetical protein
MTGPVSVSIEDVSQEPAKPAVKLEEIKLEGEDVPEIARGKTAADVLQLVKGLDAALKTSENARLQQEALLKMAAQATPVPQPEPEKPKEVSPEELAELFREDPVRAIAVMTEQAQKRAEENLERRIGPLIGASASQVENQMREKYKVEFELFGEDILKLAGTVPESQRREILARPEAWEDMISLVRGRKGNLERYIERVQVGNPEQRRIEAQREQVDQVGFTDTSPARPRRLTSAAQMDDTMKEIARNLGMTDAEYMKYYNMG